MEDPMMEVNFLVTTLFFTATFFYDYYQRFRDCNEQTAIVVNILCIGNFAFAVLSFFLLLFIICITANFLPQFKEEMMFSANKVWIVAFYPFIMAIGEIIKRLSNQRKRKICNVIV